MLTVRATTILAAVLGASLVPAMQPATQPPNVVLIIADDQRWTDFGFMGHPTIETPSLDRLAAQSALFRRGYVPSSLCRPSLASIATGLYPHQHRITGNDPPRGIDRSAMLAHVDRLPTLPKLLATAGYRSLQTGKWWEGSHARGGFTDGMTHGDPRRGGRHGDDGLRIGRQGLQPIFDFVDDCGDTPWLVWYAPFLPHTPHDPPERLLAKYREGTDSLHVARYQAMCEWFDETCGELLGFLDRRELADDTLVLFVVDNGWIQRPDRRGFAERSKRSPYDGGLRTPILVRWPGHVEPGERAALVSSIDLAPTVLRACGVEVPWSMPGVDLIEVCRGVGPRRPGVFGATFAHDVVDVLEPYASLQFRWTVQGRHKLIDRHLLRVAGHHSEPDLSHVELYDVVADPHEENDLIERDPERAAALRASLDRWWPRHARSRPRPNVLLIVSDDQRHDQLGCAGHPFLRTPNLDALAAEGVRFSNAFVTTSICAASRASILTGLHERTHGFTFGTPPLAQRFATYPRLLREAGYRTGFCGKLGVRLEAKPGELFDVFRPRGRNPYFKATGDASGRRRHLTDITADDAVEFLRGCDPNTPFCLSVSFNAPHAEDSDPRQYVWPAAFDDHYADVDVPQPVNAEPAFFEALPQFLQTSLNRVRWRWRFDDEDKRQRMTKGYWRMISGVDRAVGRILSELRALRMDQDTVVIYTSDNGYFLGERGFAGKWLIYEESIRVPLIVHDPRLGGRHRGRVAEHMVLNVDLAPTICRLAGVPVPESFQGRSLTPLLRYEEIGWRSELFYEHLFEHQDIPKSEGIRTHRHVYVRYFQQDPVHEELYDLQADPHQVRNLVGDPEHRQVILELRGRCSELRDRYADAAREK